MGEHQPTGDLVITPDTLWFEQMGETREFVISNETANTVTIQDILPEFSSLNIEGITLPYSLQAGQTVTVEVGFQTAPGKDDHLSYDIQVLTSLGERHVTAMIRKTALDFGLTIVGSPYLYVEDENGAEGVLQNRNFGLQIPVEIYYITEEGTNYLEIISDGSLLIEPGDYFTIHFYANSQSKGTVTTTVLVESSDGLREFFITINDELLDVTELSAEAKFYPNPTTGQFTVEGANVAKVEVYNLVGQKVCEQQGSKVVNIDAAEWHKGIYLVNIVEENGAVVTKKLVVR